MRNDRGVVQRERRITREIEREEEIGERGRKVTTAKSHTTHSTILTRWR